MKLKDYQNDVLDRLSDYLSTLSAKRREAEEYVEFQKSKGREAKLADYCRDAWQDLSAAGALPKLRLPDGSEFVPDYVPRQDGRARPIPNVCLKIPTGGGKTLLGTIAVDRINIEAFRNQTGLVLWVVPSDAIYAQTWRTFANREHPYRQMLERASGGRVRMLEKNDAFTKQDVDNYLCVMLIMLQAGSVKTESKATRIMFRDTGRYPSFFPDVDDANGNAALLREHPDLEVNDLTEEGFAIGGVMAKQSLANVLRLTRPLVVIDEGHKAYSATALNFIASHNPRFILELSATPNPREHVSNVLVNVTGTALKDEEMIKLPINVINEGRADWKHALAAAKEKLDELHKAARKVQNNLDRYIRPIMLIRVERTGADQRDKHEIHADVVREHLIEKLGVDKDEIRIKSSSNDELAEVDKNPAYEGKGLLSDKCPVRYIITKDALREGWDCPFAYILVVLSKTTANTALTQMVGRVLRQPGAKLTGVAALDECYVFTHDQNVQEAVDNVRRALEDEGMGDLAAGVRAHGKGVVAGSKRATLKRRAAFKGPKVFLPRVLSKHYRTKAWREFDYERDLLPRLPWDSFEFMGRDTFSPDAAEGIQRSQVRVDVNNVGTQDTPSIPVTTTAVLEGDVEIAALARLLLDVVPNPWQGARIIDEALQALRARGFSEQRIFANRLALVGEIKEDLKKQINDAGETQFRKMLADGELSFRLVSSNDPELNWELAQTLELDVLDTDRPFLRENGTPIEKSYLEPVFCKQLNGLEEKVAWYLDEESAVKWWHRIAVRQDWSLQGWQRGRVYPDFLACLDGDGTGVVRFTVLETKGLHIAGSADTTYKEKLFNLLTQHAQTAVPAGELILEHGKTHIRFELLLQNDWQQRIAGTLRVKS
ncbi:MAG: DEAD/DEAH box helicase family protein [Phycisphaeraceae bacterium]|nr:DEAD/DEAH box helicase family protein [Phycisphaeraceae bacterium]